jgi:hypothetical protein
MASGMVGKPIVRDVSIVLAGYRVAVVAGIIHLLAPFAAMVITGAVLGTREGWRPDAIVPRAVRLGPCR